MNRQLLAYGFRPFFLLTALLGVASVLAWTALLQGALPLPAGWAHLQWHSHEMIYGFVSAAAAGFLLTAMTNWTGAAPLRGGPLLALCLLWLLGRVVMWSAGMLPAWSVAAVDALFLPVLAVYVARVLLRHGNTRNLILVGVLTLLTLGNLMMHAGFILHDMGWLKLGERTGLDVVLLMMVVVAGRITPAFSANWLRIHGGDAERVIRSPTTDRLAIGAVVLLIPAGWFAANSLLEASLALLAGLLHGVRLWQWRGWLVLREPLLWILHLAYLWIVVALLLRGAALFVELPPVLWQHALGAGAIGTLIIGVMSRVALGHTGRPLKLPRFGIGMYMLISLAALLRLGVAAGAVPWSPGVTASALAWAAAFGLFLVLYYPVLSRPRADGRPG